MGYIDRKYKEIVETVLTKGNYQIDTSRDVDVIQIPTYNLELDCRTDSIPILSTKRINFQSVFTELIWFLRGETNIKYLVDRKVNIWNKDAYKHYRRLCEEDEVHTLLGEDAFIQAIQGHMVFSKFPKPDDYEFGDLGPIYGKQWRDANGVDQLSNLIDNLRKGNFNRRLIVCSWDSSKISSMALPPCHWSFEIIPETIQGETKLHLKWHQRSCDLFLGIPYNIVSYRILQELICDLTGYEPGKLIGDLSNVHIYADHLEAVSTQLKNDEYKYISPSLMASEEYFRLISKKNISLDEFVNNLDPKDLFLVDYKSYPYIKAEMIAPVK